MESATAAVVSALDIRPKEKVNRWRDSIRCQSSGMKLTLGSGAGHASAYARNKASSFCSSFPRIRFIIPLLPRRSLALFLLGGAELLQDPLPRSEKPDLMSILVDLVNL